MNDEEDIHSGCNNKLKPLRFNFVDLQLQRSNYELQQLNSDQEFEIQIKLKRTRAAELILL